MIAVPSAMIWPSWFALYWAEWMDAWTTHLNPRYRISQRDLDELAFRCAEWQHVLDRRDGLLSVSDSSRSSR